MLLEAAVSKGDEGLDAVAVQGLLDAVRDERCEHLQVAQVLPAQQVLVGHEIDDPLLNVRVVLVVRINVVHVRLKLV